jgi:hypothetical protein
MWLAWRRACLQFLVGKLAGRRRLARPRYRWEDSKKIDLTAVGW